MIKSFFVAKRSRVRYFRSPLYVLIILNNANVNEDFPLPVRPQMPICVKRIYTDYQRHFRFKSIIAPLEPKSALY